MWEFFVCSICCLVTYRAQVSPHFLMLVCENRKLVQWFIEACKHESKYSICVYNPNSVFDMTVFILQYCLNSLRQPFLWFHRVFRKQFSGLLEGHSTFLNAACLLFHSVSRCSHIASIKFKFGIWGGQSMTDTITLCIFSVQAFFCAWGRCQKWSCWQSFPDSISWGP